MEKITMRIEADTVEQAREIYGRMTREGLRYVKGEYEVLLSELYTTTPKV